MYMSYCRFEGTCQEMKACLNEVDDHIYEEAEYDVSENEIRNFRNMMVHIADWMAEQELLDEYGEINHERLDEICEQMRHSYQVEE